MSTTLYFTIPTTGYMATTSTDECPIGTVRKGDKCKPVLKDCPVGYKRTTEGGTQYCVRDVQALHTCQNGEFF